MSAQKKLLVSLVMSLIANGCAGSDSRWISVEGGSWAPTAGVLGHIERKLQPFVTTAATSEGRQLEDWATYTLQYQGQETKGLRTVKIQATCRVPPGLDLNRSFIIVYDGGTCYFSIQYDPVRDAFFDLEINGES